MCVIVVKNKGVKMPNMDTLKKCFDHNPDGAGYMYTSGDGFVHIRKGFMTWKEFKGAIGKLKKQIDIENEALVMHFRISTQAGVNKQCCHPYPLSKNMEDLKKLNVKSKIGVAHNGIIELTSEYEYYGFKNEKKIDYNDTMKFITDYLSLIIKNDKFYNDKDALTLIERLCGSKLAIMDSTGHITLVGAFEEKDGIYYSNLNHEKPPVTYSWKGAKGNNWNGWNDWHDCGYNYGYNCKDKDYGYEEKDDDFDVDDYKEQAHYYSIPINNAYELDGTTYIMDDERAYITGDMGYEDTYEVDCHTLDGKPMVAFFSLDYDGEAFLEDVYEF